MQVTYAIRKPYERSLRLATDWSIGDWYVIYRLLKEVS